MTLHWLIWHLLFVKGEKVFKCLWLLSLCQQCLPQTISAVSLLWSMHFFITSRVGTMVKHQFPTTVVHKTCLEFDTKSDKPSEMGWFVKLGTSNNLLAIADLVVGPVMWWLEAQAPNFQFILPCMPWKQTCSASKTTRVNCAFVVLTVSLHACATWSSPSLPALAS